MSSAAQIPDLPSEEEIELACETSRKLAAIIGKGEKAQLCV